MREMLRISSAASGEEVTSLDVSELAAAEGVTVAWLKRHLAERHFEKKCSRFQLKLLREGHTEELPDHESLCAPLHLQLVMMSLLPPEVERDRLFHDACEYGAVASVEHSLKALQDPNVAVDGSALCWAASETHLRVVRLLLEARAETDPRCDVEGGTALHHAAERGHLAMTRLLLDFGADARAVDADGSTPLHFAAFGRQPEVVRLLLLSGGQMEAVDSRGRRPLHEAARAGMLQIVRLFLDAGAQKDAEDFSGWRPLHSASAEGHVEVVQLLIDVGADMEAAASNGSRPLHEAAAHGRLEVVRLLLAAGAQKRAKALHGRQPIHEAATQGHAEVVGLLLQGVKRAAQDAMGNTPSQLAARCGHMALAERLYHEERKRRRLALILRWKGCNEFVKSMCA